MTEDDVNKSGPSGSKKGKGTDSVGLNRDIQGQLGDQLRQMYNDVVGQGVPDRFVDLLAKLDKSGDHKNKDSSK